MIHTARGADLSPFTPKWEGGQNYEDLSTAAPEKMGQTIGVSVENYFCKFPKSRCSYLHRFTQINATSVIRKEDYISNARQLNVRHVNINRKMDFILGPTHQYLAQKYKNYQHRA